MNDKKREIEELHRSACDAGKDSYVDPATGYTVFTEYFHLKRGHCCGSGCRHCPWKKISQKNPKDPTDPT
ncbi:DUF5522 domain-containing protein [Bdellovibrio bacteriovorus]|uniref:Uncharacterized protein n=1 Tax=Bdellovibrio bacteriovorus TaxID=959 RepID=A0A1Z3NA94_BDEBC|nr:hypothetical protein B9G79_12890 [Bdellovibrio bacteriovorus]